MCPLVRFRRPTDSTRRLPAAHHWIRTLAVDGALITSLIASTSVGGSKAGPSTGRAIQGSRTAANSSATRTLIALGACCATNVAWSPNGKLLAVGGRALLRILHGDGSPGTVMVQLPASILSLAWSPDSRTITLGSPDGIVRRYSAAGARVAQLTGHTGAVNTLSWLKAGPLLATGSSDGTVRIWQADNQLLTTLVGDGRPVESLAWSSLETAHGNILAIATTAGVRLQTVSGRKVATLNLVGNRASVAWSPGGTTLATGSRDGAVRLWSSTGLARMTLPGHTEAVTSIAWSPDGTQLAAGSADRTIRIWSQRGKPVVTLSGYPGPVLSLSWSPDSRHLASTIGDATIRVWHLSPVPAGS